MNVNGVTVLHKLVAVSWPLDDKGVIHKPEPQSW